MVRGRPVLANNIARVNKKKKIAGKEFIAADAVAAALAEAKIVSDAAAIDAAIIVANAERLAAAAQAAQVVADKAAQAQLNSSRLAQAEVFFLLLGCMCYGIFLLLFSALVWQYLFDFK